MKVFVSIFFSLPSDKKKKYSFQQKMDSQFLIAIIGTAALVTLVVVLALTNSSSTVDDDDDVDEVCCPVEGSLPEEGNDGKTVALIFGCDDYEAGISPLVGCVNDMNNVRDLLVDKMGVDAKHICAMPNPTKSKLMEGFDWLIEATKNKGFSTAFVYFSGHGSHVTDVSGDEIDNRDETIVTTDGALITDDEINAYLVDNLKSGTKLVGVFDTCHSGTMLDCKYSVEIANSENDGTTSSVQIQNTGLTSTQSGIDVVTLCSSRDAQVSLAGFYGGEPSSLFTYYFCNTLRANPTQSLKSLLLNVHKGTSASQIPVLSSSQDIESLIASGSPLL